MTYLFNDPVDFRGEMIDGYVAAFGRYVRRVPGTAGIVANDVPDSGRVAVVIGGGSGHFPAFYGLVGAGMASGAAIGDVFASPSGEQVYRVAKAASGGRGVLFVVANYAGDVLNFGMAASRLRAEGIDTGTALITDDLLSAPLGEIEKRRGIAGGFYVFKTAGAGAARGDDLQTVLALTQRANQRVRTVGVAFGGCTLPGRTEPLFTVAPGRMEVGLGIHGEPGVRTSERVSASELAALLVNTLLAEIPPGAGNRATVLLNGLGATKYEELFVLYHGIAPLLTNAGIELHEPRIGEFVTSLDMAGCSLSIFWLDDELQALHDAPASTPAFTRFGPGGAVSATATATASNTASATTTTTAHAATSATVSSSPVPGIAGEAGRLASAALHAALSAMGTHEDELGRLDAAAGDGDHGAGMVRGFRAAVGAIVPGLTAHETLLRGGTAFLNAAGGASGALVGACLTALAESLPRDDADVDAGAVADAVGAGIAAMQRLGGAKPGDKTLLDTLLPFVAAFRGEVDSGASTAEAWALAVPTAEAGMRATAAMVSRVGRASRLGERSRGHQDPGATSIFYVLRAIGQVLAPDAGPNEDLPFR